MKKRLSKLLGFMVIAVVIAAIVAAAAAAVSLWVFFLWNFVAVGVFGAPHISFLQAFGLLLVVVTVRNFVRPPAVNFKVTKG